MKKTALKTIFVLLPALLFSCNSNSEKFPVRSQKNLTPNQALKVYSSNINYFEFTPETIIELQLDQFDIEYAYQIGNQKLIAGYDQKVSPGEDQDWGNKLLLLDNKNEIVFKSKGVGDVYLFEPHFYKNDHTDKVVIICQLGFEYYFGGEAFLFENGEISIIGRLNIEGDDPEQGLTDILEIEEVEDAMEFSFRSDNLILDPGSSDNLIKNNGVKYVYKNEELKLEK